MTIRFFIVGNESSSFRRLAKFTESDELSPGWREKFMEARDFLNKSLDEYPSFQVEINGDKPTRRRILFVMLYGGLAHANDDEMVSAYRLWERDPIALTLLQNEFVIILTQTLKVIAYIAKLNAKEMGTSTG
ncbi:MAG: hypothetical protein HYR71_08785 [Chloroflexi bacterium]|nr:hypothetical protein [Chloroflexota bacterium]